MKYRCSKSPILATCITALLGLSVFARHASAADIVWSSTITGTKSWNSGSDWQGGTAPATNGDIAEFGAAKSTSINFANSTTVGGIQFDAGAPAFTISNRTTVTVGKTFTIDGSVTGAGITNNSSNTQTINNNGLLGASTLVVKNAVVQGAGAVVINNNGIGSSTSFTNTSILGNLTLNNSLGSTTLTGVIVGGSANLTVNNTLGEGVTFTGSSIQGAANLSINSSAADTVTFNNTTISTTGTVTIQNSGVSKVVFQGTSNAGTAVITDSSGASTTQFQDSASAGHATISNTANLTAITFNGTSTGANSTLTNNASGSAITFSGNSTAGNAIVTNNAAGSATTFSGNATTGNAIVTNNATLTAITFSGSANAQNATVTNNASSTIIIFTGGASGGNATLVSNGTSTSIDISSLTGTGTTAGSIAGSGQLLLGAKNLTVGSNNTSTVFSGIISDGGLSSGSGGSLTKVGTGALELTGVNTYNGGTNFNGGIVAVNQDANLGTGGLSFNGGTLEALATGSGIVSSKTILLNAGGGLFLADAGTSSNFSGPISGTGSFTKEGSGALQLSGSVSNTYTGTTFVTEGLLELNHSGGSIAIPGALVIGGPGGPLSSVEVRLLQSSQISSGSSVTVNADGLLNVNGQTAKVGAVTVNDGSVSLGAGSLTVASLQQTGGAITGSGNLVLNGNVIASADAIGNAALIASGVDLAGGSRTFTVNGSGGSAGLEVTGDISNGSLVKSGSGAMYLEGSSTYTGSTTVNSGALFVDGSIASANTLVQPGALIGGHGTIGGNLFNNGTVSPGNSPGTLTVNGNFNQSSAGTLLIQIGGLALAQHDLLKVGGNATLGGTLQLAQLNQFHFSLGEKVTFLTTAGQVTGTFGAVVNPFDETGLVGAKVIYQSNAVSVEAVQNPFTDIPSLTPNQHAVAVALDNAGYGSRTAKLFNHLDYEPLNDVLKDLDRIAPDELTSIYQIGIAQAKIQTANLERRLEDVRAGASGFSDARFSLSGSGPGANGPQGDVGFLAGPDGKSSKTVLTPAPENRWGVFVTGDGEWANVGDTYNSRGYDLTSAGFTVGVDFKATPHLILGVASGYSRSDAYLTEGGRITVDGGKFALYGSYFTGGFYADAAFQGGYNTYNTNRAALEGTARGTTDGGEFSALFGTGYDWKRGGLKFGPIANFEYTYVGVGSFTERGSLAPLDLPNQHQESIRSTIGARASYDWKLPSGVVIRPEIRAGWQHEYGDATLGFDSRFSSGAGSEFLVHGPATGRDSLLLSAGFAILLNDRTSFYVFYDGELARENYEANSVSGGIRVEF